MQPLKVNAPFKPAGDQPGAIRQLTEGISSGIRDQTLLGVTGSGKTFTLAKVIEEVRNLPWFLLTTNTCGTTLWRIQGVFPR